MSFTYPLGTALLNDLFVISGGLWKPKRYEELVLSGGGEFTTKELAPMVWTADVELAPMEMDEFRLVRSRFMLLQGSKRTFLFASPESAAPYADPHGTTVAGSSVKVRSVGSDNVSLQFKGLPAGYALTPGDFFGIIYNSTRRALHVVTEGGNADGSGNTGDISCQPPLRFGVAVNDVVSLAPPVAKVKLIPDSLDWSGKGTQVYVTFSVIQTLGA